MTAAPPLILASASPRRRHLLATAGYAFEVVPAAVDESPLADETPPAHVQRLARAKAATVAARFPDRLVLGADTVVSIDGDVLGKPADPAAARAMIARLAGRTHHVYTGVAICRRQPAWEEVFVVDTAVTFRPLTAAEIDAYLATAAVLDKAGAYAIQETGASLVAGCEGSYTNVVGLPMEATAAALARVPGVLSRSGSRGLRRRCGRDRRGSSGP